LHFDPGLEQEKLIEELRAQNATYDKQYILFLQMVIALSLLLFVPWQPDSSLTQYQAFRLPLQFFGRNSIAGHILGNGHHAYTSSKSLYSHLHSAAH
jgi:hypothetical protein